MFGYESSLVVGAVAPAVFDARCDRGCASNDGPVAAGAGGLAAGVLVTGAAVVSGGVPLVSYGFRRTRSK